VTVGASSIDLEPPRIVFEVRRSAADRAYRALASSAAFTTFLLMAFIGGYLLYRGADAFSDAGFDFFTEQQWLAGQGGAYGIGAALPYTAAIAFVAMVLAIPVSVLAALFITEYAPAWARRILTSTIDLLAAVPSLIYGLWGFFYLQPRIINVSRWLSDHVAFIPIFKVDLDGRKSTPGDFASSTFIAGVVVALMIVPICTSIIREVFAQAPAGEKEGALALGATRWGVVRSVVLPFGRGGIVGGAMLGLGRALGETIAVTLIIAPYFDRRVSILSQGSNSIPSLITLKFAESNDLGISALMAAGLVLFGVTLVVNMFASFIVARSRSGDATEI
jgi:phosphate transport system permease protein